MKAKNKVRFNRFNKNIKHKIINPPLEEKTKKSVLVALGTKARYIAYLLPFVLTPITFKLNNKCFYKVTPAISVLKAENNEGIEHAKDLITENVLEALKSNKGDRKAFLTLKNINKLNRAALKHKNKDEVKRLDKALINYIIYKGEHTNYGDYLKGFIGLIIDGADIYTKDAYDYTPLFYAVQNNDIYIVKLLIELGANINIKSKDGKTLLMIAAERGYEGIVKLLLKHKVDINAKDGFGRTALIYAAKANNVNIVKMLLEHKANPNIKDEAGNTALSFAVIANNKEMVKLLLSYKANPNIKDNFGYTILDIANQNAIGFNSKEHKEIIRLLKQYGAEASDSH